MVDAEREIHGGNSPVHFSQWACAVNRSAKDGEAGNCDSDPTYFSNKGDGWSGRAGNPILQDSRLHSARREVVAAGRCFARNLQCDTFLEYVLLDFSAFIGSLHATQEEPDDLLIAGIAQ
jgi:hypothetical protein